jgi:GLPGLI family protein
MRKLLLTFSGLLPLAGLAQTPPIVPEPAVLVGTYRLTYQPDSTDPAKRSDIFYLLLGKTLSRFQSRGEQAQDSLVTVADAIPFNHESAQLMMDKIRYLPRNLLHYTIYKTVASGHVYFDDRIGLQHYRYEEPAGSLNWAITPTTATIAGYACQRATATFGGRQWEAWFTRTVPIAEGPYKFYGLPGLIVKVSDTRQHYLFELAQLTKPAAERPITLPKKTPTTTDRTAFRRALADVNADPIGHMSPAANGGAGVYSANGSSPEQMQQRAREIAHKRNNVLELR